MDTGEKLETWILGKKEQLHPAIIFRVFCIRMFKLYIFKVLTIVLSATDSREYKNVSQNLRLTS